MANKNYQISLDSEKISMLGVGKVISTTEKSIEVNISGRFLTVGGSDFNVTELNLETGRMTVTGTVRDLKFSAEREKGDFLKKIFK